jgi:hypothetical protein
VSYFENGPRFKRRRADQLLVSPTMSWQPPSPSCATTARGLGNRCGCHIGSWSQSRLDVTMQRVDKWRLGPGPEGASPEEPGICSQQHNDRQPGWVRSRHVPRQPATPREAKTQDRRSPSRTTDPGTSIEMNKTLARKGTRRSPMQAYETSPVSGASVVGMTSGVCQGQRSLPAGIPGVSTASSRKDRLWLKGRLRQQPTGYSTEESHSRATKIRFLQRLDRQKWPGPDKIDRGKGQE